MNKQYTARYSKGTIIEKISGARDTDPFQYGAHPCLIYPDDSSVEPSQISLYHIANVIKSFRRSISESNSKKTQQTAEKSLTNLLLTIISYINNFPYQHIEIVVEEPLQLKRISLINKRPALLTVSFNSCKNNTITKYYVLGHAPYNTWIKSYTTDEFRTSIPSPQILIKLFNAGIDIIHFYDVYKNVNIEDNKEKNKLIRLWYDTTNKHIFDMMVPFFLVSSKYQEPFIAAYNYLHEYTELIDEIIRIIISFGYNESKFEDISYIQFADKFLTDDDFENDKEYKENEQNMINIICEHSLLRFPHMLTSWRNWLISQICVGFTDHQNKCLKNHIKKNRKKWIQLISEINIFDGENWIYLAAKCSECNIQIPSKKVFDSIKLYVFTERLNDFKLLLETYNLNFDVIEVWVETKFMGDFQLGLFWYFICNDNPSLVWDSLNGYLSKLYEINFDNWYKLCVEYFLCQLFFKFYGSLKKKKKLQCMKNTIKLLKIWKNNLSDAKEQSLYLVQCFNSCNYEIFERLIDENILNINVVKKCVNDNKINICIYDLFEAFKGFCPLIQTRRYNNMVTICKWLYRNECGDALEVSCQNLINQIENQSSMGRWRAVIRKLQSLKTDWIC